MSKYVLVVDSITVTVDGSEYGTIVPPEGGFASEAENLKSMAGERWKEGSPMAPFDTDVSMFPYKNPVYKV